LGAQDTDVDEWDEEPPRVDTVESLVSVSESTLCRAERMRRVVLEGMLYGSGGREAFLLRGMYRGKADGNEKRDDHYIYTVWKMGFGFSDSTIPTLLYLGPMEMQRYTVGCDELVRSYFFLFAITIKLKYILYRAIYVSQVHAIQACHSPYISPVSINNRIRSDIEQLRRNMELGKEK